MEIRASKDKGFIAEMRTTIKDSGGHRLYTKYKCGDIE